MNKGNSVKPVELLVHCTCNNSKLGVSDVCVKLVLRKEEPLAPYLAELARLSTTLLGERSQPKALFNEQKEKIDLEKPVGSLFFPGLSNMARLYVGKKKDILWVWLNVQPRLTV